jgi:hypothetical protein
VTAPEVLDEDGAWAGCRKVPLLEPDEPEKPDDELPESVVDEVESEVDTVCCWIPAEMPITATTASPPAASSEVTRRISRRPASRLRTASSVSMVTIPSVVVGFQAADPT